MEIGKITNKTKKQKKNNKKKKPTTRENYVYCKNVGQWFEYQQTRLLDTVLPIFGKNLANVRQALGLHDVEPVLTKIQKEYIYIFS